jgi:hypothetical protein
MNEVSKTKVALAIFLPLLLLCLYVWAYAHNFPYFDEWGYWNTYKHYVETGNIPWDEVFKQHKLQWLPVMKLSYLFLGILHADQRWLSVISIILALTSTLLLWRTWHITSARGWWIALAVSLALFNPSYTQVWLWSSLFIIWIPTAVLIIGLWLFRNANWKPWQGITCLAASLVSMGAYATAAVGWICVLLYACMRTGRLWAWPHWSQRERRWWSVWTVLHIAMIAKNVLAGAVENGETEPREAPESVWHWLLFLFRVTGIHLSWGTSEPTTGGQFLGGILFLAVLAGFAWWLFQKSVAQKQSAALGLALAAFGAGSCLLVAIGRFTPGYFMAMETRYSLGACFLPLGLLMTLSCIQLSVGFKKAFPIIAVIWFGCITQSWIVGWRSGIVWDGLRNQDAAAVHFSKYCDDSLLAQNLPTNPKTMRSMAAWLSSRGLCKLDDPTDNKLLKECGYQVSNKLTSPRMARYHGKFAAKDNTTYVGHAWIQERVRPADLILATAPDVSGNDEILAMTHPKSENQWARVLVSGWLDLERLAPWELQIPDELVAGRKLRFWALDHKKRRLQQIAE